MNNCLYKQHDPTWEGYYFNPATGEIFNDEGILVGYSDSNHKLPKKQVKICMYDYALWDLTGATPKLIQEINPKVSFYEIYQPDSISRGHVCYKLLCIVEQEDIAKAICKIHSDFYYKAVSVLKKELLSIDNN